MINYLCKTSSFRCNFKKINKNKSVQYTPCIHSSYVEWACIAVKKRSWWRGPGCVRDPYSYNKMQTGLEAREAGMNCLPESILFFYFFIFFTHFPPSTSRRNWQSRTKQVIMTLCTSLLLPSAPLIFPHWSSHHRPVECGRDTGERKPSLLFHAFRWWYICEPLPRPAGCTPSCLPWFSSCLLPFWCDFFYFLHIISPLWGLSGLVCYSVIDEKSWRRRRRRRRERT